MQFSHYPRILFKPDGSEKRVNSEAEMAAAVAEGWEARALPSLESLEGLRIVRSIYPRILFKPDGGEVLEARAANPEERAALEAQGYAIRPLPGEVIEPAAPPASFDGMKVPEAVKLIDAATDAELILRWNEAELQGGARKTILEALAAKLDALTQG